MMLKIRPLLRLIWTRAGCSFVGLVVLASAVFFRVATADAQVLSNLFIYPFNPAVSKISVTPGSRWGLFRESDTITVSTTDNSLIRILAENGSLVYLGLPTSLHVGRGHYFVECNGDRTASRANDSFHRPDDVDPARVNWLTLVTAGET